jgi:hypothetical protein
MARRTRTYSIPAHIVAALAVTGISTSPAPAQGVPPTTQASPPPEGPGIDLDDRARIRNTVLVTDAVERALDEAEQARLAGQCERRNSALYRASNIINPNGSQILERTDETAMSYDYLRLRPEIRDMLTQRYAEAEARPCPPGGQVSYNSVQIAGGYGETRIPRGNYGFVRDGPAGTPERPAAFSQRQVPVLVFEGSAEILGFGRVSIGYREGDASNRTVVPASTTGGAAGAPYTDNAPSGSTGVGGTVGLGVDTEVKARNYHAGYRIGLAEIFGRRRADARFRPYVGLTAEHRDRDYRGTVSITTPVLFTQSLDQSVEETTVGAVVGAEAIVPLGTRARFTLGGEIGLYAYDFDLSSVESVTQNFGPASDRAFTSEIEAGKSGVGYTGEIRGEFVIDVSGQAVDGGGRSGVELVAGGGGRFISHFGRPANPFSGDFVLAGGTTLLDTDDGFDWHLFAGIRLRWANARP